MFHSVFDGCSFVDSLLNSTRTSAQSIAQQALQMIESANATLKCPIPVESIDVKSYTINVPDLGPIAHVIGDVSVYHNSTKFNYTTDKQFYNPTSTIIIVIAIIHRLCQLVHNLNNIFGQYAVV